VSGQLVRGFAYIGDHSGLLPHNNIDFYVHIKGSTYWILEIMIAGLEKGQDVLNYAGENVNLSRKHW
jgi:hypothetical protein